MADLYGHTVTSSAGSIHVCDPIPELQAEIEALKEQVGSLMNEVESLTEEKSVVGCKLDDSVNVGPNDLLVLYFNVANVPSNRVEAYMKRAKESLSTLFEERGLKGRVLWVPTRERETSFASIGIEKAKLGTRYNPLSNEEDLNVARREMFTKQKYPAPVMG